MGEKKVTKMLIKVDLQCSKCYKKIKKVLCGIHQIRDQLYDEKANAVLITVVCCSPEKIKEKIWCKGGDAILGIEIVPDKPRDPEKPEKPKQKVVIIELPDEVPKIKGAPKDPPTKPPPSDPKPKPPPSDPKPKPPPSDPKPKPPPSDPKPKPPTCPGYPPPVYAPGCCCCPCCQGYGGGPCYGGYGYGRPPPMCYDGCGRPAYECQGNYFSEENPSGCMIM